MHRHRWTRRRLARTASRPVYRPLLEELESRQLLSTAVLTGHDNNARTGWNATETTLTPANVNQNTFGVVQALPVDGELYAQPLYLPGVTLPDGSVHNIVYAATEHDSVYAFDADTGALIWHDSFIDPANGIDTFDYQADAYGCPQITPEIGITATPVISVRTGAIYVVDQFKDTSSGTTVYHQQLHALDLTSGAELDGGPVEITGTFGSKTFDPHNYKDRPALLMVNGIVYTSWSSHCDIPPAEGWMMAYDGRTLQQVAVFNTAPTGDLNTIWQGGGGPAADAGGFIYFETGNGTHDIANGDFSESFVKLDHGLAFQDFFAPSNWAELDDGDLDLGSGSPMVLPDQPGNYPRLLIGGGKDGRIFLLNRDDLGQENANFDRVVQELPENTIQGGIWDAPAYFQSGDNRWIYYAGSGDSLKAFALTNGLLSTTYTSKSGNTFGYPGATATVSSNGDANGIVWAIKDAKPAVLYAYDATDLSKELYDTTQAPNHRDQLRRGVKFAVPTVADGKVFVGTMDTLYILGLLPSGAGAAAGGSIAATAPFTLPAAPLVPMPATERVATGRPAADALAHLAQVVPVASAPAPAADPSLTAFGTLIGDPGPADGPDLLTNALG